MTIRRQSGLQATPPLKTGSSDQPTTPIIPKRNVAGSGTDKVPAVSGLRSIRLKLDEKNWSYTGVIVGTLTCLLIWRE